MIKPAFIFTDHAVLQCDRNICIWGECSSDMLAVKFDSVSVSATVRDGRFEAVLPPMKAGTYGELRFVANDGETVVCSDVAIGEVWLAGGQSNMEHPAFCTIYDDEALYESSDIRFFTVPRRTCYEGETFGFHFIEQKAEDKPWKPCTYDSAAEFTAIGAFFALKLYKELNIPIGIISCNFGATLAECWADESHLQKYPLASEVLKKDALLPKKDDSAIISEHIEYQNKMKEFCQTHNAVELVNEIGIEKFLRTCGPRIPISEAVNYSRRPSVLRHSMLERIIPYTLKGVIWYQGESNAAPSESARERYKEIFSALMSDWRETFRSPCLPFYTVQLSSYISIGAEKTNWAEIRDAQWELMNEDTNCYTVMSYDIGEIDNIHPARKQVVGERLADAVLKNEYGIGREWLSPSPKSCTNPGKEVTLTYDENIFLTYKGDSPRGIFIKYSNGQEFEAAPEISGNKIKFTLPDQAEHAAEINYARRNFSICNIYTSEDLPLASFSFDI